MPLPRRARLALVLAATFAVLAVAHVLWRFAGAEDPCPTASTPLVLTTRSRTLWLCEAGRATAHLPVALGSAGVDKRVQGDRRTPIGTYTLGTPHPSSGYGTFIPIAYPTEAQRKQGFTGTAVGIHGPRRRFRWLGPVNAWFDWSGGCVAVADDAAIAKVVQVASRGRAAITIR